MRTLAAIRTHRWGEDEERLLAALKPAVGDDIAVAASEAALVNAGGRK